MNKQPRAPRRSPGLLPRALTFMAALCLNAAATLGARR